MKWTSLLIYAVGLLVVSCNSEKEVPNYPMMGDLHLGPHQVGFKTLFRYDKSKFGVPYSDWDGKLTQDHRADLGRQYQINLWYPAKSGSGTAIQYDHYLKLMGRQTNFQESKSQEAFALQTFINQTNGLGGNGRFTDKALDTLLQLDVTARLDGKFEAGQFPVLVFPNGSSPAFQSITAEFLASHGYVVVGFAPKGRFSFGLEISTIGLETAVDDLEFVLGSISELPIADVGALGLIGNAISSSTCAAAASRNQKIKALVSLEGGLPSAFEQNLLMQSVFYQPENIQLPILVIYAPHPSIDPQYLDYLKYAPRYCAHFPAMSEFAMLNFGMFDSFIPNIIGKHDAQPQRGYEIANELMLKFLNLHVKNDQGELFDEAFMASAKSIIDTVFTLAAQTAPPDIAILKDLFLHQGFEAIDSTYWALKNGGNLQPFSMAFYPAYRSWLAWKKDPNHSARLQLYQLAFDSYPESPAINYYLGYYLQQKGQRDQAHHHFKRTLTLLQTQKGEELDPAVRDRILRNTKEALQELIANQE